MDNESSSKYPRIVLMHMANQEDTALLRSILTENGVEAAECANASELSYQISERIEAVIIAEEALSQQAIKMMSDALATQPEWSDLPFVIALSAGSNAALAFQTTRELGNVIIAGYPRSRVSLANALHSAFRNRSRQRRMYDLLKESELAAQASRETSVELEKTVHERTAELAEQASQLRFMAGELIQADQRERERLAGILHDHLQQLLVGAKYRMASLNHINDEAARTAIQDINKILGEMLEATRSLAGELNPPIMQESGLRASMEWLVNDMHQRYDLTVHLEIEADFPEISPETKIVLFESTRELLSNVITHAHVKSAEINIRRVDAEMLKVEVLDRGIGFISASANQAGFGLATIRERLKMLGGSMEINSSPGNGCRVSLKAPLTSAAVPVRKAHTKSEPQFTPPIPAYEKPVHNTIRVLVADDHAVMRQSLATALAQEPDIVIIGEANDGKSALEKSRSLRPDVVLMDLSLPGISGIEATHQIHAELPNVHVIGLSMFEEKERAKAMFDAGADAYLNKSCSVETLAAAIRRSSKKTDQQ